MLLSIRLVAVATAAFTSLALTPAAATAAAPANTIDTISVDCASTVNVTVAFTHRGRTEVRIYQYLNESDYGDGVLADNSDARWFNGTGSDVFETGQGQLPLGAGLWVVVRLLRADHKDRVLIDTVTPVGPLTCGQTYP